MSTLFRESYVKYDAKGALKSVNGKIKIPIRFECSQLFDGTIMGHIEIEEEEHHKYLEPFSRLQLDFLPCVIEGKTYDGKTVIINNALITRVPHHYREGEITLSNIEFQAPQFEVKSRPLTSKESTVMLGFGALNFRLFRASVQTKVGKLVFLKHPRHDQIVEDIKTHKKACLTCYAQLNLNPDIKCETVQEYLNAVKMEIERVLTLSSFAQGISQDWMFCEIYEKIDNEYEIIYADHRLPRTKQMGFNEVVSYLDMVTYLSRTYPNYGNSLNQEKGFEFALQWYLESLGADVIESKFILGFICLELLVDKFKKVKDREFILDRSSSKSFIKNLKIEATKILESMGVEKEKRNEIYSGLRGVNRYSFKNNLKLLLEEHKIGYKDLFSDLDKMINIRHEIAHRGLASIPFQVVFENYMKLMCLNQRILLAFLNYDGGSMMDWLKKYEGKAFTRDPLREYSESN